jgi:DNA-binding transcriptional regulator LsrR (DeoR family)
MDVNLANESDDALIVRVAWHYYVGGLNQEETANKLGITRARTNRLLSEARESGLVSISINHEAARDLALEDRIAAAYGLDFCLSAPPFALIRDVADPAVAAMQSAIARRAVGAVGATFLRGKLSQGPVTVGVGWGRTMAQLAQQLSGASNPDAHFVTLLGSLTQTMVSNPFEVGQAFAARTGGRVHYLPIPFVANTEADREVLVSQRAVLDVIEIARKADLHIISVGELKETAIVRQQNMISPKEMDEIRRSGAVADTLGHLYDIEGREVDHPWTRRSIAVSPADLQGKDVVLLAAGFEKIDAIRGVLRAGFIKGLIIDGDTAAVL